MKHATSGSVAINRGSAAVTNAAGGEITFMWGTALIGMLPGAYLAEVEVVWPTSEPETFPSGTNYWDVTVGDDIA